MMQRHDQRRLLLSLACLCLVGWSCRLPIQWIAPRLDTPPAEIQPIATTPAVSPQILPPLAPIQMATASPAIPSLTATALLSLPTFTPTPRPSFLTSAPAACVPDRVAESGQVIQILDGDTFVVQMEAGALRTVRWQGILTLPEAPAAPRSITSLLSQLLLGQRVLLIPDAEATDNLGRLPRYVFVDEQFLNYELVKMGYAMAARTPPNDACYETFKSAEGLAEAQRAGLWAPALQPTPTRLVVQIWRATPYYLLDNYCLCTGPDLDCKDFSTQADAQACYEYCKHKGFGDIFRLVTNKYYDRACLNLP